ncbi:MFS transporter [Haloplanus aerogenes]|uniref:MFS transporter n=1 Tax=Haloplanus aerogenes TaxID=660522 RepID=A0A3M0DA81_9EURY|nr:MFS transporter [Haloplanus aerogenes]AZH26072.1 MFS transporter [Haloplanus aerogenes]RMB18478.1 nitrate/nitrite transporter NarK [Haloplanus aerogenes]
MVSLSVRQRRAALWSLLAAGFLFVNFHRTATAVLADSLARTFDATGSQLGLLHASFFYIYAALQLPAGLVVDRYGPRWVGATGLAVLSAGVVWFAWSETLLAAFLARAVVGFGGSVLYIATLRFCANWFRPDEYATMTGYTVAAAGAGGILATTPLALAIDRVGWRFAILATGMITAVVAVVVATAVRDRPSRADIGVDDTDHSPATLADIVANTRTVLGEVETWLMGLLLFLVLGVNFTVLGLWGVPFIADTYGVTVARASTYVLLGNVGFVLGSPAFGALSDRTGWRTELVVATTVVFSLSYGALILVPPLPVVGAALFCALLANGGVALVFTVGKERHEPAVAGTVTGVINSLGYVGAAILPTVMGAVLDAYWTGEIINGARVYTVTGYRVAFGIATGAAVVAVVAAFCLHRRESRTAAGATLAGTDDYSSD